MDKDSPKILLNAIISNISKQESLPFQNHINWTVLTSPGQTG